MQNTLIYTAPAKINLALSVLRRRSDGYHDLSSVMQQVSLADTLILRGKDRPGWSFYCSDPTLGGKDNLVCRAASLLGEATGKSVLSEIQIFLYKNIPVEAGLAGGSSDAAAALLALNKYWGLGLKIEELMNLGAQLGSDVPYCLLGGTALAEGRGEILMKLPALPFFWVVLAVPPGLRLSTAAGYRNLDLGRAVKPPVEKLVGAICRRNIAEVNAWFDDGCVNTFEDSVLSGSPTVKKLKEIFRTLGLSAVMSGSGPSVFALTRDYRTAREAVEALHNSGNRAYLSWTVS